MSRGHCSIVGDRCKSPAGYRTGLGVFDVPASTKVRTKCFKCGEFVCVACSRLCVVGHGRVVRYCETCDEARGQKFKAGVKP